MSRTKQGQPQDGASHPNEIGPQDVRARAFEIYVRRVRHGESGDARSDWLRAERELHEQGATVAARGEALMKGDQE